MPEEMPPLQFKKGNFSILNSIEGARPGDMSEKMRRDLGARHAKKFESDKGYKDAIIAYAKSKGISQDESGPLSMELIDMLVAEQVDFMTQSSKSKP